MGLETKEKVIDGLTVSVTQFPGMEAIRVQAYLANKILPSIAGVMGSLGSLKGGLSLESDVDSVALSNAVSILVDKLTEKELETLILRLLVSTRIDSQEVTKETIDITFGGRTLVIYKILAFVIKVNYPDFFGLGASIGSLMKATGISSKDEKSGTD